MYLMYMNITQYSWDCDKANTCRRYHGIIDIEVDVDDDDDDDGDGDGDDDDDQHRVSINNLGYH
jgi:hypothetical protein